MRLVTAELEERALRVLVTRRRGRRLRVESLRTLQLGSEGNTALADGLADALLDAVAGSSCRRAELVLVLRNRQVACGEVARPGSVAKDAVAPAVIAGARKLGVYAENEELVIGYRLRAGAHFAADVCAAPRAYVDEVVGAAGRLAFARVRVLASETVLAAGLAHASNAPLALLDLHGDRALLVLAQAGRPLAARRFKLPMPYATEPDGSDHGTDIAPLLLAEVTRSLAFFAEQGRGDAQQLLLSGAFRPDSELVQSLSLLPLPVAAASMPVSLDLDAAQHGLAYLVPALVTALRLPALPCLVEPERTPKARIAALVALQCTGALGLAGGGAMVARARAPAAIELGAAIAEARAQCDALSAEVDTLRRRLQEPPAVRARQSILHDLDRGPAARSALCEAIARGRPDSLSLTLIELSADGSLTLTGVAKSQDRLTALNALAELENNLRTVPGFGHGRGALDEAAADGRITFRLTARLEKPGEQREGDTKKRGKRA